MADGRDFESFFEKAINIALEKAIEVESISGELGNPDSYLDTSFLLQKLQTRKDDLKAECAKEIQDFNAIKDDLDRKSAAIERYSRRRWFEYFAIVLFGFFVVFLLIYLTGHASNLFTLASNSQVLPNIGDFQLLVAFFLLTLIFLIIAITWRFFLLPKRKKSLENEYDIEEQTNRLESSQDLLYSQLDTVVLRNILEIINASKEEFFQVSLVTKNTKRLNTGLRVTSDSGLSETPNTDDIVHTKIEHDIKQKISGMPGASIGISGPRGAGKSTVLISLCTANLKIDGKDTISIYTASPVEYDGREFLLHIFSTLCRQILKTMGLSESGIQHLIGAAIGDQNRARISGIDVSRTSFFFLYLGIFIFALGVMIGIPMFEQIDSTNTQSNLANDSPSMKFILQDLGLEPGPFLLWGGVLSTASFFVKFFLGKNRNHSGAFKELAKINSRELFVAQQTLLLSNNQLAVKALNNLIEIQFQRNYTSGWSGALKAPVGFEIGTETSVSFNQVAQSFPELVDEFRSFVTEITKSSDFKKVVIGIDELDKLNSAAAAERFLNEMKTVFNIPDCYYLVAVSENALSNFERRGLPVRDTFDSVFDNILHINYLTSEGSRNVLFRRILNLPANFLYLCHVLSGGLPRDLVRITRLMLDMAKSEENPKTVREMTELLLQEEARTKLHAASIAAREIQLEPNLTNLLIDIARINDSVETTFNLSPSWKSSENSPEKTDLEDIEMANKLEKIRRELACYFKFLNLVHLVFDKINTEKDWIQCRESNCIEVLAKTRQDLELGIGIAEFRVNQAKKKLNAKI